MSKLLFISVFVFLFVFSFFLTNPITAFADCNEGGCCQVNKTIGSGGRGTVKQVQDNCNSGFHADPVYGTTDHCFCKSNDIAICQRRQDQACTKDSECFVGEGCGNWICVGFAEGRKAGICQDSTNVCSKANQTCKDDSECSGGSGCSLFTCHELGRNSSACRLGVQQKNTTTGNFFYGCSEQQIREGKCTGASGVPCPNGQAGINTALGCLNPEPSALVQSILKFSVGVGGGIAFLLMIFGAFQMITSAGSAEALKAGQERFYSAIIGLLFLIFSVLLLKIIGVDILGFGTYFGLP